MVDLSGGILFLAIATCFVVGGVSALLGNNYRHRLLLFLIPFTVLVLCLAIPVLSTYFKPDTRTRSLPIVGKWSVESAGVVRHLEFRSDGSIVQLGMGDNETAGTFEATNTDQIIVHWHGEQYGETYRMIPEGTGSKLVSTGPSGRVLPLRRD